MKKPRFYQAKLERINDKQLMELTHNIPLEERLPNNGACEGCGMNDWWIYPKESILISQVGKPYVECLNCGYITHL